MGQPRQSLALAAGACTRGHPRSGNAASAGTRGILPRPPTGMPVPSTRRRIHPVPPSERSPGPGNQPSDESRVGAAALYAKGHRLANRGQWADAEAAFYESAQLAPDASLAWLSAAVACFQQKRFTQASVAIEWALQAIPTRSTPESERGVDCAEAKDWRCVEEMFRRLLARGSPETSTYLFLSFALIRLGRFDEAFEQLVAGYQLELAGAR